LSIEKKGEIIMNAVKNENYSPEQISDAEKILEVYAKLPNNKKPMLMVIINALISGMEIQEMLAGKQTI
jgi:hypothetical protein